MYRNLSPAVRLVMITRLFPKPRPRLLGRWHDLLACTPVMAVSILLAVISLDAATVIHVSLKKSKLISNFVNVRFSISSSICAIFNLVSRACVTRIQRNIPNNDQLECGIWEWGYAIFSTTWDAKNKINLFHGLHSLFEMIFFLSFLFSSVYTILLELIIVICISRFFCLESCLDEDLKSYS